MKALVTGGAGFTGSNPVDRVIQISKIEFVFQQEKPDYVFHPAARKDDRFSVFDPITDEKINIPNAVDKRIHTGF